MTIFISFICEVTGSLTDRWHPAGTAPWTTAGAHNPRRDSQESIVALQQLAA